MNTKAENLIALFTALIAVGALAYQIWNQRVEDNKRELREWQSTIVYRLIDSSKKEMDFDSIYTSYLNEIKNEENRRETPSDEFTKNTLTRILLELREKGLIGYSDSKYYVRTNADDLTTLFALQFYREREFQKIDPIAYKKIVSNPGVFSEAELYLEIKRNDKTKLSEDEFSTVIESLMQRGKIGLNKNKKLAPIQ